MIRIFGWSLAVTIVVLAASLYWGGWEVFIIVAILGILEISLSFDNAVVNATVLERMSDWWQRLFLTIGIIIAVFGMRLLFPLLIVAITAGLGPIEVIDLAVNDQEAYAQKIDAAHPSIAAFGGMFLIMIFLDFMLEEREHAWIGWLERPLARAGGVEAISVVVALLALVLTASFLAGESSSTVMISGALGLITYLAVNGLASFFEGVADPDDEELAGVSGPAAAATGAAVVGKAAFFLFMYLELLDASFSFDGVIGAFAITSNIFIIAAGLGIGAMYIRSITVYLVRKGTLDEYVYLEHGAHYAIGALAVLLLISIRYHTPEVVTGLIGVGFILLALFSSLLKNRRDAEDRANSSTPASA